ncbi:MAG: rhodanese-like domain-containing protein [Chloroflexi bacterium]|nr:rhodanese-like domain-containing protein [Chloroflexota bacterium]
MPIPIERHQLQQLPQQGAQLVDVLPAEEYTAEHLLGVINLPLASWTAALPFSLTGSVPSSSPATTLSET